jgi:hypothetical protein
VRGRSAGPWAQAEQRRIRGEELDAGVAVGDREGLDAGVWLTKKISTRASSCRGRGGARHRRTAAEEKIGAGEQLPGKSSTRRPARRAGGLSHWAEARRLGGEALIGGRWRNSG